MSGPTAVSKPVSRVRDLAGLLASPADSWLALRTIGWICILPLLKRTVPLPRLVRLMWLSPHSVERNVERERRTIRIVGRLSRASGGNCLERSLIVYRYLARAGADPRLVVGISKPGEFLGHVWVTVDGRPMLESPESLRGYTELVTFRAGGAQEA